MNNKLVSIILPVYNVDKYLDQCLNSVKSQTYSNIEIIIINDGSTDNSLSIINEFISNNLDLKIILINQENKGLSEARNSGLKIAKGDYVYFLDSDDFIINTTIEDLYRLADVNKLDCIKFDALSFNDNKHGYEKENLSSVGKLKEYYVYTREEFINDFLSDFQAPVWLYFIKTEVIKNNKLLFYPGILHEDELFTVQLLLNCNEIMYAPKLYFHRRIRENSIMTSLDSKLDKSYESCLLIVQELEMIYANELSVLIRKFLKMRQMQILYTICLKKKMSLLEFNKLCKTYNINIKFSLKLKYILKKMLS